MVKRIPVPDMRIEELPFGWRAQKFFVDVLWDSEIGVGAGFREHDAQLPCGFVIADAPDGAGFDSGHAVIPGLQALEKERIAVKSSLPRSSGARGDGAMTGRRCADWLLPSCRPAATCRRVSYRLGRGQSIFHLPSKQFLKVHESGDRCAMSQRHDRHQSPNV